MATTLSLPRLHSIRTTINDKVWKLNKQIQQVQTMLSSHKRTEPVIASDFMTTKKNVRELANDMSPARIFEVLTTKDNPYFISDLGDDVVLSWFELPNEHDFETEKRGSPNFGPDGIRCI